MQIEEESKKPSQTEVPWYLEEIANCTPAGVHALIGAWDGLSSESHILLLKNLQKKIFQSDFDTVARLIFKNPEGERWINKVYEKGIASPNAYVRYLSARFYRYHSQIPGRGIEWEQSLTPEQRSFYDLVRNDKSPLVRFVYCSLNNPDFWDLPQEARLALSCEKF